jgi:uncharacterized protein (DUF58 family)
MINREQNRLMTWLENRWLSPSYGGMVLGGIAVCFFGAATNTMAGWLYVLSGTIFALLIIGGVLPLRSLKNLRITRLPIAPVSVGDQLVLGLQVENLSSKPQTLLQVRDFLPHFVTGTGETAIEYIAPRKTYQWVYYPTTTRRGIYQWYEVELRTGSPLGLFWCSRNRQVPAKAIVYPTVLPLTHCPLMDSFGQDESTRFQSDRLYQNATEGITRNLRAYRHGDPTRLIHWRTSARFGDFKVRELEVITGGQDVIIALDTISSWNDHDFEQAVIAAASLYFYGNRCQLNVRLWTASTGILKGNRVVLEALAATQPEERDFMEDIPNLPLVWLTQNPQTLTEIHPKSRLLFFGDQNPALRDNFVSLLVTSQESLQIQLQRNLALLN